MPTHSSAGPKSTSRRGFSGGNAATTAPPGSWEEYTGLNFNTSSLNYTASPQMSSHNTREARMRPGCMCPEPGMDKARCLVVLVGAKLTSIMPPTCVERMTQANGACEPSATTAPLILGGKSGATLDAGENTPDLSTSNKPQTASLVFFTLPRRER